MFKLITLLILSFIYADPPTEWEINIADFLNSSSITSSIYRNEVEIGSQGDMLAAFVGDEIRGIAPDFEVGFGPNQGKYFFLILIYSNVSSGEVVTFKFYDSETDSVYDIDETYNFEADDTLGNLFEPFIFNTGNCTDDDNDDICDSIDECIGQYDSCGICNGDDSTCIDCNGVVNGNSLLDNCGICDDNPSNDCLQDCLGSWGGNAIEDECGVCNGNGPEENYDCLGNCLISEDCLGICGGYAVFDECGVCDGNNENCNESVSLNLNQETGWDFYQSTIQGSYGFFGPITINGQETQGWTSSIDECHLNPYSCDVIGAFHDGLCVGWNYISPTNSMAVTVMGNIPSDNETNGYLESGDIPDFYIFDSSSHQIYLLSDIIEINPFSGNFHFSYLFDSIDADLEVGGCIEQYADNYDLTAQIYDPFNPCFYLQNISFQAGPNIFSINLQPDDENETVFDILSPLQNNITLIKDEASNAIYLDQFGNWADNIGLWQPSEGYIVYIDSDQDLEVLTKAKIDLPITIDLDFGWNIISYPIQDTLGVDIETVLSDLINEQSLTAVFNQRGGIYVPDYQTNDGETLNSIVAMNTNEGYYVNVNTNTSIIISEPESSDLLIVESGNNYQSRYRNNHFIPSWSGYNPSGPMTIDMTEYTWDDVSLQEGDEVGIFDGDVCVGSGVVRENGKIYDSLGGEGNEFENQIVTSGSFEVGDVVVEGFESGNQVKVRVWRSSESTDIDATIDGWQTSAGVATSKVFESLAIRKLDINVYPPSSFVLNVYPQSSSMNLTWSRPNQGDYKIYEGNNSVNAILFNVIQDDVEIEGSIDDVSLISEDLSYNQNYTYRVLANSVVGSSVSNDNTGLTKPGIPIFSGDDKTLNSNHLYWINPEVTGNSESILYTLMRDWEISANEEIYDSESIVMSSYDIFEFIDTGLLNTTLYRYKIKAENSSGSSGYSSLYESQTLDGSSSIAQVENIILTPSQTIEPVDNIMNIRWNSVEEADMYYLYHRNIYLDQTSDTSYVHTNLLTSELMLYSIVTVVESGSLENQSIPTNASAYTLPEFIPEPPENLSLDGGQNHVFLSWNSVDGYGPPIGGAASSYKIYRSELLSYDIDNTMEHVGTTSQASYTDSSLYDNTHYCYAVSGVNGEGNEGETTEVLCTGTLTQLPASTPDNISASGGDQTVSINWDASIGSPPISYQVYRSGDSFADEFIANISSTQYIDNGLQKNTTYSYYVVATNELGSSEASDTAEATTTSQSNALAANTPQNVSVTLNRLRASEPLDETATIEWESKIFIEDEVLNSEFDLVYDGNPFESMTFVVNDIQSAEGDIPNGSMIAIFDGNNCVGRGVFPLPNGQISASKDNPLVDGIDGFVQDGTHRVYFKLWNASTGTILTAYSSINSHTDYGDEIIFETNSSPEFIELIVLTDNYNIYRNGAILTSILSTDPFNPTGDLSFEDDTLESGM